MIKDVATYGHTISANLFSTLSKGIVPLKLQDVITTLIIIARISVGTEIGLAFWGGAELLDTAGSNAWSKSFIHCPFTK